MDPTYAERALVELFETPGVEDCAYETDDETYQRLLGAYRQAILVVRGDESPNARRGGSDL